jgi:hypothetical protein
VEAGSTTLPAFFIEKDANEKARLSEQNHNRDCLLIPANISGEKKGKFIHVNGGKIVNG